MLWSLIWPLPFFCEQNALISFGHVRRSGIAGAQGEQLLVSVGTSEEIDIKLIVPMYGSTRSLQVFQLLYILANLYG